MKATGGMKTFSRWLAVILAVVCVLGVMPLATIADAVGSIAGTVGNEIKELVDAFVPKDDNAVFNNNDTEIDESKIDLPVAMSATGTLVQEDELTPEAEVQAIIVLRDDSVSAVYGDDITSDAMKDYQSRLLDKQHNVADAILALIKTKDASQKELTVLFNYTLLLNGFAAVVPYGVIDEIKKIDGVLDAYPAEVYTLDETDAEANGQIDTRMVAEVASAINAQAAWDAGYDGTGTAVAIIDTGLYTSHEMFTTNLPSTGTAKYSSSSAITNSSLHGQGAWISAKIPFAYNYYTSSTNVAPTYCSLSSHGTHVAGIAAGYGSTVNGIARNAQIIVMQVFAPNDGTSSSYYLSALEDCATLGVDSCNLSLGSTCGSSNATGTVVTAYNTLANTYGVSVCGSSGNNYSVGSRGTTGYTAATATDNGTNGAPACYDNSFSVNAYDVFSDSMAEFSSWGPVADALEITSEITAPGYHIYSSVDPDIDGSSYAYYNGTSMSTPFVTGLTAMVNKYVRTSWSSIANAAVAARTQSIIMSTATVLDDANGVPLSPRSQGAGLINAGGAVTTKAYLSVSGSTLPIVQYGEDADGSISFSFTVNNFGSSSISYSLVPYVITEDYTTVDGIACSTRTPLDLTSNCTVSFSGTNVSGTTLTVASGGTSTVTVSIALSSTRLAELQAIYTNGFYLEGFVKLNTTTNVNLSLPFFGYVGDFSDSDFFESRNYWDTIDGDRPITCTTATGLGSYLGGSSSKFLWLGVNPYIDMDESNWLADRAALSPNNDGYYDSIDAFNVGVMRNLSSITYTAKASQSGTTYYTVGGTNVIKMNGSSSHTPYNSKFSWSGTNASSNALANNATAYLNVTGTLLSDTSATQSWGMGVTIDTEKPTVASSSVSGTTLTITASDNQYLAYIGVFSDSTYTTKLGEIGVWEDATQKGVSKTYTVTLSGTADTYYLAVGDYAHNTLYTTVGAAASTDSYVYQLVTGGALESGATYLVVYGAGTDASTLSTFRAMGVANYSTSYTYRRIATAPTFQTGSSNSIITAVGSDTSGYEWTMTGSGTSYTISNGTSYLYSTGSGYLYAGTTTRNWTVSTSGVKFRFVDSSASYPIYYSTNGYFYTYSSTSTSFEYFFLYKKVAANGTTPTTTGSYRYVLTTTVESGETYLIGYSSNNLLSGSLGSSSNLTYDTTYSEQYSSGIGYYYETANETLLEWVLTGTNSSFSIKNAYTGTYATPINASSQGYAGLTSTTSRYWSYGVAGSYYLNTLYNTYYPRLSCSSVGYPYFYTTSSAQIFLYKKVPIYADGIASASVTPTEANIAVGAAANATVSVTAGSLLTALGVTPQVGVNYSVTWASSKETVATVNAIGSTAVITGVSRGDTVITATVIDAASKNTIALTVHIAVGTPTEYRYARTTTITSGNEYLLGYVNGDGEVYILPYSSGNYPNGVRVFTETISGTEYVTGLWSGSFTTLPRYEYTFTASGSNYAIYNSYYATNLAMFTNPSDSSVYTMVREGQGGNNGLWTWTANTTNKNGTLKNVALSSYYLAYYEASNYFSRTTSSTSTVNFVLYERVPSVTSMTVAPTALTVEVGTSTTAAITIKPTDIAIGTDYLVEWSEVTGTRTGELLTLSATSTLTVGITAGSTTGTTTLRAYVTDNLDNEFTVDVPVTVYANSWIMTYSVNGNTDATLTQTVSQGSSTTLPTAVDITFSGYVQDSFIGWVAASIQSPTDTAPTFYAPGATYTPTADTVLYALFATQTGAGGTSDTFTLTDTLTAGDYVFGGLVGIAGTDNVIAAMNSTYDSSLGWIKYARTTPVGGVITMTDSNYIWTLTINGAGISLCNKSTGQYLTLGTGTGSGSSTFGTTADDIYYAACSGLTSTFELFAVSTATESSGNQLAVNLGTYSGTADYYGYRMYAQSTHGTATTGISTQMRFYKAGTAATYGGYTTILVQQTAVSGVAIDDASVGVGTTATITPTLTSIGTPVYGTHYTYGWSIANGTGSATISAASGATVTVTGVASGTATLTCTLYGADGTTVVATDTATITIAKVLSSIAVTTSPTTLIYEIGGTFASTGLAVTATYDDGSTAVVTGYTLSAPDMTTAGIKTVTVTYVEGGITRTTTFQIAVGAADTAGGTVYVPTDTIVAGEEYLIGLVVNSNVYLIMNYNPSPITSGNNYYYSSSSNYYGYTALATKSGDSIVGCSGWASDLQYCLWTFSSTTGGKINSCYNTSYNLAIYNSTTYTDLHPSTSTSYTSWVWNSTEHTLTHVYSSSTKYASYMATVGSYSNFCYAPTTKTSANSYVQLYSKTTGTAAVNHDVAFYDNSVTTILSNQTVANGAYATAPTTGIPTIENYQFDGWTINGTSGTVYTAAQVNAMAITANTYFVAHYALTAVTHTLTINYVYAGGGTAATAYTASVAEGAAYSVASFAVTGYTPDTATVGGTMGTADVTVTVTYTANSHTVYYVTQTGDAAAVSYQQVAYSYGAAVTQLTDPAAVTGYTFGGWRWYSDANHTTTYNSGSAPTTMPDQDLYVIGVYQKNTYHVYYYVDGALTYTDDIVYGAAVSEHSAPAAVTGYTFSGWTWYDVLNGTTSITMPSAMPAYNLYVYGTQDINTHNVTYYVDGVQYQTAALTYGATVTAIAAPTQTGYTFSGWTWYETANGTTPIAKPATMPDYDLFVYGTFSINSYTVTYYVDYANGNGYIAYQAADTYQYNAAVTPKANPTQEYYVFGGWTWYNAPIATGTAVSAPANMPAYNLYVYGQFTQTTNPYVTGVSILPETATIEVGATQTITASVSTQNGAVLGTDYTIMWSVDNSSIGTLPTATNNQTSVVLTGAATGTATVTCTVYDANFNTTYTDTSVVTVGAMVNGITITHLPNKVIYEQGAAFSSTGLAVAATYTDGSAEALAASAYTISSVSTSALGNVTVTVSYTDADTNTTYTATFDINVVGVTSTVDKYYLVNSFEDGGEYIIVTYDYSADTYYAMRNVSLGSSAGMGYAKVGTHFTLSSYGGSSIGEFTVAGSTYTANNYSWTAAAYSSTYYTLHTVNTSSTPYLYSSTYLTMSSTYNSTQARWGYDSSTHQLLNSYRSTYYYLYYSSSSVGIDFWSSTTADSVYIYKKTTQVSNPYKYVSFYDAEGTTLLSTVTLSSPYTIASANIPTVTPASGMTFQGWYRSGNTSEFVTSANLAGTTFTANAYYVAAVTPTSYPVTFYDYNGTELSNILVQENTTISAASMPTNPTREGYTFAGWVTTLGGTTAYDFSAGITAATSIYASYTINNYMLTINYYLSGTATSVASTYTISLVYGAEYSVASPTYTDGDGVPYDMNIATVAGVMPASNVTVNVYYSVRTYTVTFYTSDGTTVIATQHVAHGQYPSAVAYTLPEGAASGSEQWIVNADDAVTVAIDAPYTTAVTANITYTLTYTYEDYDVTFMYVTGVDGNGAYVYSQYGATQTVTYNGHPNAPTTTPEDYSNYTFYGWVISSDGGATYDTSNVISNNAVAAVTITSDTIFRAVYYNTTLQEDNVVYQLVTQPVDGVDYIVVDTTQFDKALGNSIISGYDYYLVPVGVTLSGDETLCYVSTSINADTILWYFRAQADGTWALQSKGNNTYLSIDSTGNLVTSSTDTGLTWTYSSENLTHNDNNSVGSTNIALTYATGTIVANDEPGRTTIGLDGNYVMPHSVTESEGRMPTVTPLDTVTYFEEVSSIDGTDTTSRYLIVYGASTTGTGYAMSNTTGSYTNTLAATTVSIVTAGSILGNSSTTAAIASSAVTKYNVWHLLTDSTSSYYYGLVNAGAEAASASGSIYLYASFTPRYLTMNTDSDTCWQWTGTYLNNQFTSSGTTYYWRIEYSSTYGFYATYSTSAFTGGSTIRFFKEITPSYTVTYSVDGQTGTTYAPTAQGSSVTLPTISSADAATICSGHDQDTFVGWVTTPITTATNTAPTTIYAGGATYVPTADVTLYALFADATVTQTPTGEYKYVLTTSSSTPATSKNYIIVNASSSYSSIAAPAAVYTTASGSSYPLNHSTTQFTIEGNATDGYYIAVNNTDDNNYIWYRTSSYLYWNHSGSNYGMYYLNSKVYAYSSPDTATFPYSSTSGFLGSSFTAPSIRLYGTSGNMLYSTSSSYYTPSSSNYDYFYFFEETTTAVTTDTTTYASYITQMSTVSTYSVNLTQATGGTISSTATTGITSGTSVTLTATASSGYTFAGWSVSGGTTYTGTTNPYTFNMPAANVSVTATFTSAGSGTTGTVKYYQLVTNRTITSGSNYIIVYGNATSVGSSSDLKPLAGFGDADYSYRYPYTGVPTFISSKTIITGVTLDTPAATIDNYVYTITSSGSNYLLYSDDTNAGYLYSYYNSSSTAINKYSPGFTTSTSTTGAAWTLTASSSYYYWTIANTDYSSYKYINYTLYDGDEYFYMNSSSQYFYLYKEVTSDVGFSATSSLNLTVGGSNGTVVGTVTSSPTISSSMYTITYSSSNTGICTVDSSGTVYPVAAGAASVTSTCTFADGTVLTATTAVTVSAGGGSTVTTYYTPVDTITDLTKEYLIGFIASDGVYLLMNYNPDTTNNYYYTYSSNYWGYAVQAVTSGTNIVGVKNDVFGTATAANCEWKFSSTAGGTITSAASTGYRLRAYTSSTSYTDCYPVAATSDWTSWVYNSSSHYLYYNASTSRYVTYQAASSSYTYANFKADTSSTGNTHIQLYMKVQVTEQLPERFTLTTAANAGTIKLYQKVANEPITASVTITPTSATLYVLPSDVTASNASGTVTLNAEVVGLAVSDIASVSWSASGTNIITYVPTDTDGDGIADTAAVTGVNPGTSVVTITVIDKFGYTHTASSVITVLEKETGEIPPEVDSEYTEDAYYHATVYEETTSFVNGQNYIIAAAYPNSTTGTAYYYERTTSSVSAGNTYVFAYGDRTTLANCSSIRVMTSDYYNNGSYYLAAATPVIGNSNATIYYVDGLTSSHYEWDVVTSGTTSNFYLSGYGGYMSASSSAFSFGSAYPWTFASNSYNQNTLYYSDTGYYVSYSSTDDYFYPSYPSSTSTALYTYLKTSAALSMTASPLVTLAPNASTASSILTSFSVGGSTTSTLATTLKQTVTYYSENTDVATVDANGIVTAVAEGETYIYTVFINGGVANIVCTGVVVTSDGTSNGYSVLSAIDYGSGITYVSDYTSGSAVSTSVTKLNDYAVGVRPADDLCSNPYIVLSNDYPVWTYSTGGYLRNVSTSKYIYNFSYLNSSITKLYTLSVNDTSKTALTYNSSTKLISYTSGSTTTYLRYDPVTYTSGGVALWLRNNTTDSSNGMQFRIFQKTDLSVDTGIDNNITSSVDIFANNTLASQTSVNFTDVNASDTISMTSLLNHIPQGATGGTGVWTIVEQSLINGSALASINASTGVITVGSHTEPWQGYIIVGYTYTYTYDGRTITIENYGRLNLTSESSVTITDDDDLPGPGEPGYVAKDKTAEGINFLETGVGSVDISTYGIATTKPVDVVLVIDASGSMDEYITGSTTKKIAKAKEAASSFANILLEGTDNTLAIVTFGEGAKVITGDCTLTNGAFVDEGSLESTRYYINKIYADGGTDFDSAMSYAYALLYTSQVTYGEAHDRCVVFMTDGTPTQFNTVESRSIINIVKATQTSYTEAQMTALVNDVWAEWVLGANYTGTNYVAGSTTYFTTAQRSYYFASGGNVYSEALKDSGSLASFNSSQKSLLTAMNGVNGAVIPTAIGLNARVYSIGFDIASGAYANNGNVECYFTGARCEQSVKNLASSSSYYYSANLATDLTNVFQTISQSIQIAATNAAVTDVISEYYDLCVTETTTDANNDGTDETHPTNVITVSRYTLDDNFIRTSNKTVIETVTMAGGSYDANGNASITGATSSILGACYNSTYKCIQAQNFSYYFEDCTINGTQHYAKTFEWVIGDITQTEMVLDFCVNLYPEYRTAGQAMYPTNEGCELTYTDSNGSEVEKEYPIPELPWQMASTYYELYLVNEQGQPVSLEGVVVPFADRVIIYSSSDNPAEMSLDETTGTNTATFTASSIIAADPTLANYTLYDPNAAYTVTVGDNYVGGSYALTSNTNATVVNGLPSSATPTTTTSGSTTTYTYNSGSLCATYVSFPITLTLTINPDVIIIDYGLGVTTNVTDNDIIPLTNYTEKSQALLGVGNALPTTGTVTNAYGSTMTYSMASSYKTRGESLAVTRNGKNYGTVEIVQNTAGRYLVKYSPTTAMLTNPQALTVYYAVEVSTVVGNATRTAYMYESLTIVPATVMYYDDSFPGITYGNTTYASGSTNSWGDWSSDAGESATTLQHTSNANTNTIDDVFGYDSKFTNYDTHSLNSYHTVDVKATTAGETGTWPTVQFTFQGTGFEVVADSKITSGLVILQVYSGSNTSGELLLNTIVDNYYGDGNLYQIPVIHRDMTTYGTYTVVLTIVYNQFFANGHTNDTDKTDLETTIDAIRIFEPIDTSTNAAVLNYYLMSNEAYPTVSDMKDMTLAAYNLAAYNDIKLYEQSGSVYNLVTTVTSGSSYVIVNPGSGNALGLNSSNQLVAVPVTITASGSSYTITATSSALGVTYLWAFTQFGETTGYTIAMNSRYLTIPNGGDTLTTITTAPTEGTYGAMWVYDGDNLIAGPRADGMNGVDRYYALGYYDNFLAVVSNAPYVDASSIDGILHMDGGTTDDPSVYVYDGPNNEVYLVPGSSLTFQLSSAIRPTGVYLEIKSPAGYDVSTYFHAEGTGISSSPSVVVGTATGMYYDITSYLTTWTWSDDAKAYISNTFMIYNGSTSIDIQHILSICNIRFTYNEDPATSPSNPFVNQDSYQQIAAELEAMEWKIYSPLYDLDIHTMSASKVNSTGNHFSYLNRAYIYVETSTDVANLIVKDANGAIVQIERKVYNDVDGVRYWTLTVARSTMKAYNLYVTTVSAVFDMVNPVSMVVRVPSAASTIPPIFGGKRSLV